MDKKYFMLKAMNRSPFMEKERPSDSKALRGFHSKNDSFNQRSLLVSTEKEKPGLSLDFPNKRNLSTEKQLQTNEARPSFPKTT